MCEYLMQTVAEIQITVEKVGLVIWSYESCPCSDKNCCGRDEN